VSGDDDGFNDCTASLGASHAVSPNLSVSASITYIAEFDVLEADTEVFGIAGVSYTF